MLILKLITNIKMIFKEKKTLFSLLAIIFIFVLPRNVIAQTVNATSSLPAGCSECPALPPAPAPAITEAGNAAGCGTDYGVAVPDSANTTYTLTPTPCLDNAEWKARLNSVNTTVKIERSCPSNPATVLCSRGVAALTKAQACTQHAKYPSPLTQADLFTGAFESDCWCRDCVAEHEEAHMNTDWVQDSLNPEINTFNTYLNSNGIAVDCGTPSSLDCNTSVTVAIKAGYDTEWQARLTAAVATWNAGGEGPNGYAAEIACYQAIIGALNTKCTAP